MEKSRELNPLTFGPYEFANGSVAKGELDPTCDGGFLCRDLFGALSAFCMYTELGVQLNTQTRLKAVREIRKWGTGLAWWERRIWFSNINSKLPAIASLRCAAKVRAEQYSADVFLPAFVICLLFSSLHHRAQCAFWLIKTYACTFWRVARTEMNIVDEKKKTFFFLDKCNAVQSLWAQCTKFRRSEFDKLLCQILLNVALLIHSHPTEAGSEFLVTWNQTVLTLYYL